MDELILLSILDNDVDLYNHERSSFSDLMKLKEYVEMDKANKLLNDIERVISCWDEYSQFKFKNVENLSLSDLDTLKLYANYYIKNNAKSFYPLANPTGVIKAILDDYEIKVNYSGFYW